MLEFADINTNVKGLIRESGLALDFASLFAAGHCHISWWVERQRPVDVACPVTYEKLYWPSMK
ncbi:hypothetical protein KSB_42970 [Ktedonobacter robiniae]|uniref:Uncharacterized protein n=1 Tax=Ktedonobacter robiniae TaxID=2778365 RepID=A0ABQ3UT29_9CHLR|nr:hypothetical protein KSB_42970 [Ktedonobacter robiniae]